MKAQTTMAMDLDTWQEERKLDEACCRLLANKVILARLLKAVVEEYQSTSLQELEQQVLEGTPSISTDTLDQDIPDAGRIKGENTVDKSIGEGNTTYDILFSAYSSERKQDNQVIINVESQSKWNPGYPLLKRDSYYYGRLLSRQKGTVFTNSQYQKLEKVYTIWICLEPPNNKRNSITVFSMEPKRLVGHAKYAKMNYDMATIIMVCLGSPKRKEKDILKLLSVLLSPVILPNVKKRVLEQDYAIPMTVDMEREAESMCNIGRGLAVKYEEKGLKKGIQQERESNILGMLKEKIPMETIARITKASVEQIREIGKLHGVL